MAYDKSWKQLDRLGEHNVNSHEDSSKYLKHDQIVAVTDAVAVAPQLSAAQLRRNLALAREGTAAVPVRALIRRFFAALHLDHSRN